MAEEYFLKAIRKEGKKVPPLSIVKIRSKADKVRQICCAVGMSGQGPIDIVKVIERYIPKTLMPDLTLKILDDNLLGNDDARTYPDKAIIEVKESVYISANTDDSYIGKQARFTLGHELGHLFLHQNCNSYARGNQKPDVIYSDSEWQADNFCGEFMMPFKEVLAHCISPEDIADRFNMSISAARIRFNRVKRIAKL